MLQGEEVVRVRPSTAAASTVAAVQVQLASPTWQRRLRIIEFGLLIAGLALTRILSIYVWQLPNGDVTEYWRYALSFWTRHPYLHWLPVEYPPLAIVPFTLTLLPPFTDYQGVFAFWMGALAVLGYVGFLRYSTRRRAITYAVYLVVGAAATLLARFDLVPALVTLAALWATQRRHFGYAYALIAIGVLLKLYPGFLLPVVVIAHWRAATARAHIEGYRTERPEELRWWRGSPRAVLHGLWAQPARPRIVWGTALCLGIIAFGFWGTLALNAADAFSGFSYATNRPLQVESTPASLLWLGTLIGIPAHPDYSFVSLNYVGPLDVVLKPLSAIALLAVCGLVYWRQARGKLTAGQAFVACLSAVLVTNKIFSPQYLIWILPIVAAVEGFDLLWLAVCLLTTVDFPIIYQMRHPIWTVTFTPAFMLVLMVRNVLLLYITVRAIVRPGRAAPGSPAASITSQRIDAVLRDAARRVSQPAAAHVGSSDLPGEPGGEHEGAEPTPLGRGKR
jgi:hypothetical protein